MAREGWQCWEKMLSGTAFLAFAGFTLLQFWFWKMSPRASDSGLGAIYPLNWHGTLVYLTAFQQAVSDALFYGSGVLFLAAVLIDVWVRPFRK
jgi:hypothetical protein